MVRVIDPPVVVGLTSIVGSLLAWLFYSLGVALLIGMRILLLFVGVVDRFSCMTFHNIRCGLLGINVFFLLILTRFWEPILTDWPKLFYTSFVFIYFIIVYLFCFMMIVVDKIKLINLLGCPLRPTIWVTYFLSFLICYNSAHDWFIQGRFCQRTMNFEWFLAYCVVCSMCVYFSANDSIIWNMFWVTYRNLC